MKAREDEDGRWRRRNEDVKEREGKEEREEGTIFLPASASFPSLPSSPPLSFYSPSGKIVPQPRRNYTYRAAPCYVIYI